MNYAIMARSIHVVLSSAATQLTAAGIKDTYFMLGQLILRAMGSEFTTKLVDGMIAALMVTEEERK